MVGSRDRDHPDGRLDPSRREPPGQDAVEVVEPGVPLRGDDQDADPAGRERLEPADDVVRRGGVAAGGARLEERPYFAAIAPGVEENSACGRIQSAVPWNVTTGTRRSVAVHTFRMPATGAAAAKWFGRMHMSIEVMNAP